MNTWTKQSKLDYLLNYEYKDYHQQDVIDWITKIGLNEVTFLHMNYSVMMIFLI